MENQASNESQVIKIMEINEVDGTMLIDWGAVQLNHWIPDLLLDGIERTEEEIRVILESERPLKLNVQAPTALKGMIYVKPGTPIQEAKDNRDNGQFEPIEVQGLTFDAHSEARTNISWAVKKFGVLDALNRSDGTLDWTLADNTVHPVTKELLIEVEDAIVIRKAVLHKIYTDLKNGEQVVLH